MLQSTLLWILPLVGSAAPILVVPSQPIASAPTATAVPAADEVEELIGKLRLLGNRVSIDTLTRLAKIGTTDSLSGFALALDGNVLTSDIARARALRAMAYFAKSRDVSGRAREMLANFAANARNSLEGIAGVETLAASGGISREWLVRVVDSPALTAVRVRAFELHRNEFDAKEDAPYYRKLWEAHAAVDRGTERPSEQAGEEAGAVVPLGAIAGLAFEAIASSLPDDVLRRGLEDRNPRVRTAAMAELAERGDKSIIDRARSTFLNTQYGSGERAESAAIYGAAVEWTEVFVEVERSLETMGPRGGLDPVVIRQGVAFTNALASLMMSRPDESFADAVAERCPEARPGARAFYVRALGRNPAKSAEKLLKRTISDEDLAVRVESLRTLALRGTEGARKLLDTQLRKASTDAERGILVELTTELYGGDPAWASELEKLAKENPSLVKNAALTCLARIGGAYEALIDAALDPAFPWGTQRAAIEALRDLRSREAAELLVLALDRLDQRAQDLACESLRQLTGETFRNASVWPRWWADNGTTFVPLTAQEYKDLIAQREQAAEEALGQEPGRTVAASFFGVELDSERLAFVIDCSGSMKEPMRPRSGGKTGPTTGGGGDGERVPSGGTRLEVAQNELLHFLKQLPESALVNVVRFSNDSKSWSDQLKSVSKETTFRSIRAFVERLNPDGGTNVHAGLKEAFDNPDVDTVMLLSDGEPTVGEVVDIATIANHVRIWNANRGVTLHVISIGTDQPILRTLAEETGGSYTLLR